MIAEILGLISPVIDFIRGKKSNKPVLNIIGQEPGDYVEPHQVLTLTLKNFDEAYTLTLESVEVDPSSWVRIKVLKQSDGATYLDPGKRPFGTSDRVNMVVAPGQEYRFLTLFSKGGREIGRPTSIFNGFDWIDPDG